MLDELQVTDQSTDVEESADQFGNVPEAGTITAGQDDGEAQSKPAVDWEAKYKEMVEKSERDINGLRSSLDRRFSQQQKEWEEREATYRQQLQDLQMRGMTEEQKAEYVNSLQGQRYQELERKYQETQNKLQTTEQERQYIQFFKEMDIAESDLVIGQGLEVLYQSGWDAVNTQRKQMRAKLAKLEAGEGSSGNQDGEITPPNVAKKPGGKVNSGPTWAQLRKQLGVTTDEEIYLAVETGQLDPSILPK